MIFRTPVILLTGFLWLCSACVQYKPTLKLEDSTKMIPARVYVQPLKDASPSEDKENAARHSLSQTSTDSMEGDLDVAVTRAILAGFSAASAFTSISDHPNGAELILSGMIYRFYGRISAPTWLLIPGIGLAVQAFWSPIQLWQGEVDLELTLASPNGHILGTYRGRARYEEIAHYDHHYWAMPLYPAHARLNDAFTEAVRIIREQMLQDRERLMGRLKGIPADFSSAGPSGQAAVR